MKANTGQARMPDWQWCDGSLKPGYYPDGKRDALNSYPQMTSTVWMGPGKRGSMAPLAVLP